MTNFGPGAVYGIFFVAAFLVVALPVSLISLGLERFGGDAVGGYTRSLSAVLGALLVVFLVFSVATGANPFTDFAVPFILVSLYVVSLLGAGGVVRLVTDSDSDTCLRTATLGWLATLVLVTASMFLGLLPLVASTPSAFGIAGFSGYVVLQVAVAMVAGGIGSHLVKRGIATDVG